MRDRPDTTELITATVTRTNPDAQTTFSVDGRAAKVVLDVLVAIQQYHDATLAFRYSCRVGKCGTCTIRHNGRAVLACQTPVGAGEVLHLGPLGGFPVVRDLIVDMAPFVAGWSDVVRSFDPARLAPARPAEAAPALLVASEECISCGACYSACPVAGTGLGFLGPAAITRAAGDPSGGRAASIDVASPLNLLTGLAGCHSVGACSIVCPRGLDPARVVRRLRHKRIGAAAR